MEEHETRYAIDIVQAMAERTIKRLWVIIIILIVLLALTNGAWIWYESTFVEEITETYTSETDGGGTAIVNRDGEVRYGESDVYKDENQNP